MTDALLAAKFAALCEIVRAQHFAWRDAVRESCPDVDAGLVVRRMWEITGEQTAAAYRRRIDRTKPLAAQIADGIVFSSRCMGEDAHAEAAKADDGRDEAFVRHAACPWPRWHERNGLTAEDRPGCDRWFDATLEALSRDLGATIRFETLESLPEGGASCLRRIWVESRSGASRRSAPAS